jgi:ATP-binding cassette subfamily F protein uup
MSSNPIGEPVLSAQSIVKSYGAQPVLQGISLTIHEGERIGLIGRNGSGKSTLLKVLAGHETPEEGLVTRRQGLRVGLMAQDCALDMTKTIGEVLEDVRREIRMLLEEYEEVTARLAQIHEGSSEHRQIASRHAALRHTLELADAWNLAIEIRRISMALELPDADRMLTTLSGGELRRLDLAAAILTHPDVLLLDEPTNHIDTKSVEWIETFLADYQGSCVLVTHDRYFLEQIVSRIIEIEFSRLYSFPGNYEHFLEYKSRIKHVDARTEQGRQAAMRRELAWLRRGPKARGTKQKARIHHFADLAAQDSPEHVTDVTLEIPAPPRLGKRVVEAEEISCAFEKNVLFKGFSFILQKGMRVGVIGPNGCGKTTLLRALMGQQELNKGRVLIGDSTQFLYVDQTHSEIKPDQTILDFVSNGAHYWEVNGRRLYVPGYLERFLFDMEAIHMPMRNLSGGERNRIELARKLLKGGNILVLDEPTNDLDLPTLRVIEEAILAFDGCALLVSHDRYFLNRLCTNMIAFEGAGRLAVLAGNYDDYLIYKQKQQAVAIPEPVKPLKTKRAANTSAPRPRGLMYREQQELAGIHAAIEMAETEVARFEAAIHQKGFYEREYTSVQETLNNLTEAKERVDALYARWEDLERRQRMK